jgi:predicted  nucleic acid-binding Zn-ribbon protein
MIDENFLESAVRIRRTYLKVSNNMDLYHRRAKEIVETLENTLSKIDSLQQDLKQKSKSISGDSAIKKLLDILQEVEDEGARLEKLVEPMNKEIEKLGIEEQELYRQIKEKHSNLTEEQIVESVRTRLIKEGLS